MKKLIFTVALASLTMAVSAQVSEKYDTRQGTYEMTNMRGPYQTGRFFDNTFISIGGGMNIYNGKGDTDAPLVDDRIAPTLDVAIGKWVTPSVGLRLAGSWGKAKGFSTIQTPYTKDFLNSHGYYKKKFDVWTLHGDVMWNLTNALGGYKEHRVYDVIPFVGMGGAWSEKGCRSEFEFAGFAGIINNFRLGGRVDLNVEGRYMFVKSTFDRNDIRKMDGMLSVTAGLAFKIGPKEGFKRPAPIVVPDYSAYQNRINRLEKDLGDANARNNKLAKDLDDCLKRPVAQSKTEYIDPSTVRVYFPIGKTTISEGDMVNIKALAETMKANPEAKYKVVGYADNSTGTPKRNMELSKERAENVAKALRELGVNPSQLSVEAKGGVKNFKNEKLDRAVVIE